MAFKDALAQASAESDQGLEEEDDERDHRTG
jgi:hypothetical protein